MTNVRFVRNPGFKRELQNELEFVAFMRHATEAVAEEARRVAPKDTGYYARHIKTRPADYIVYTDDIAGHLIEWGSANNNVIHAPLRRGVRAAGLRLDQILR